MTRLNSRKLCTPVCAALQILLLLWANALHAEQTVSARPNVLLVYVDDLGYGDTHVYGHPVVQTPNIDQLAAEGARFTNFYSPSALCSPSRAGLLTGRTPYRTGVKNWIPDGQQVSLGKNEITIARILKDQGYRTAVIGKWHLNGGLDMKAVPQPRDFGFDYQYGLAAWVKNESVDQATKTGEPRSGPLYPDNMYRNNRPVGKTQKFSAELVSDEAIDWLAKDKQPFFLYLTYSEVHAPIASPVAYSKHYDRFLTDESRAFPWLYYFDFAGRAYRGSGEYYANITFMDAQLGRVLDYLREQKVLDNTLVIFSSDNGPVTSQAEQPWEIGLAGETGGLRGKKRYLFEGGIRVPGIIRFPGLVKAGLELIEPATALDMLPTITSLIGVEQPVDRPIDGVSLLPIFAGQSIERTRPFYWSLPTPDGMEFAIRDGDWKLILDSEGEPRHLYNLSQDFYEIQDQIDKLPEKVTSLRRKFDKYHHDIETDPIKLARESAN